MPDTEGSYEAVVEIEDMTSVKQTNNQSQDLHPPSEENESEWELEEDLLRFLKTIALYHCVTGTPNAIKLLDDIFLVYLELCGHSHRVTHFSL